MPKKSWFVLIAAVVLTVTVVAVGGGGTLWYWLLALRSSSQTSWPTPKPSEVTIPFELANKHVMLKVTVNNSRPLWFVLDTGDKFAIIDLDRAKELGLALRGEISVAGAGAQLDTGAFVKDSTFSLPGFAGFSQPLTLAIHLKKLAPRFGQDFDGIIGSEFIKQFVLELDYQARVIKLHDQDKFVYSGPGESVPSHLNHMGHLTFEAEVTSIGSGPIRGEFVLDIGSSGSLTLHSPFVAEHHLPGPNVKTIKGGSAGAGGETKGQLGRVSEFKMGKFKLSNVITLFSEDKAGALASPTIQGSVGEEVLSKFKIFLDYRHDHIILETNATFAEAFDRASSGLRIEAEGKDYRTFRITEVLENSPGSEAGLQKNDIINAIDERPASELTLTNLGELFERPVSYRLTVGRGGQILTVTLTPRNLV